MSEAGRRGFEWWSPHDHARHSAQLLLAGVATICAAYLATVVIAITIAVRIGDLGSRHFFARWQHRLGPFGLAGVVVVLIAVLAALIAAVASESLASRATRLTRARPLADGEADHARRSIEAFALGVGFPAPSFYVIDDRVPNGFATGRRRACAICLTGGALKLPNDQVDALCAQTLTSVCNRALPLTCAAADLLVAADWCTNVVWGAMGTVLVSTLIGVPPLLAAATTVAIALLVVCTKPLLAVADRAIPRLRHRSAQLADLDAVRVTNQPAALARLLLAAASDTRTVASPWQLANLWFDADTSRPAIGSLRRSFLPWMDNRDQTDVGHIQRAAAFTRQALIERARLLVDQTSGEPALRAQLELADRRARGGRAGHP